jgi:hypothetical protein
MQERGDGCWRAASLGTPNDSATECRTTGLMTDEENFEEYDDGTVM